MRQPVGYLQAWPWTLDGRERIQQVAIAGLELGTAGMQVRDADHSATLPPEMIIILFITLYGLTSLSVYANVHFLIGTNVYDFQGFC